MWCYHRHPQWIPIGSPMDCTPHGGSRLTKFKPNMSIGLACSGVHMLSERFCKIARGTCNRPVYNRHHRLLAISAHRMNIRPSRSGQPFGLQRRKCLDRRTYTTQTSPGHPFSSDLPEEIFLHKGSMLTRRSLYTRRF